MNVIVMQRAVLRVSYGHAEKRLNAVIRRGRRLADFARGSMAFRPDELQEDGSAWYGACLAALKEIYPTTAQADVIHRAWSYGQSWPVRLQDVIDQLENMRDTVHDFAEPSTGVTILQWVLRRPMAVKTLDGLTGAAAWEILRRLMEWLRH